MEAIIVSDDKKLLDIDLLCRELPQLYWARGRTREKILRSIEHSICFGAYGGGRMLGFARVISDHANFAYICDVFVLEDSRGRGIGKKLVAAIMAHGELQGLRRWLLATKDAHGLYEQFGFMPTRDPDRWMEIIDEVAQAR